MTVTRAILDTAECVKQRLKERYQVLSFHSIGMDGHRLHPASPIAGCTRPARSQSRLMPTHHMLVIPTLPSQRISSTHRQRARAAGESTVMWLRLSMFQVHIPVSI